uniref:Uncharacterized protein n=1 Tax=Anguilla anguilla TaxID=7936 RepID=A0A0E9U3I7_ANGAN
MVSVHKLLFFSFCCLYPGIS